MSYSLHLPLFFSILSLMSEFLNLSNINISISDRLPEDFEFVLKSLWKKHFGIGGSFAAEKGGSFWTTGRLFGTDYAPYQTKFAEVALALEYLQQLGTIPPTPELFDLNGKIHRDLPFRILEDLLFRKRLLNGVEVLVIGGPEGRIFAEMGATVVGIDPFLDSAPKLDLPNLEEISDYFDFQREQFYLGRFNLTLSARLFDDGSRLVTNYGYAEGKSRQVYKDTLMSLLKVTRVGGISIHDGDSVPGAIKDNIGLCQVREVVSPYGIDQPGSSFLVYVLQRI